MTDGQEKFNLLVIFYFLFKLIFATVGLVAKIILALGSIVAKSLREKKWTIKI